MAKILAVYLITVLFCVIAMIIRYFAVRDKRYSSFWEDMFWDDGPNIPFGVIIGMTAFYVFMFSIAFTTIWLEKYFGE